MSVAEARSQEYKSEESSILALRELTPRAEKDLQMKDRCSVIGQQWRKRGDLRAERTKLSQPWL